jgi:hypothetical protein
VPKVLSSYLLSPQQGERVRVRGEKKELLATIISGTIGKKFWVPGKKVQRGAPIFLPGPV